MAHALCVVHHSDGQGRDEACDEADQTGGETWIPAQLLTRCVALGKLILFWAQTS